MKMRRGKQEPSRLSSLLGSARVNRNGCLETGTQGRETYSYISEPPSGTTRKVTTPCNAETGGITAPCPNGRGGTKPVFPE